MQKVCYPNEDTRSVAGSARPQSASAFAALIDSAGNLLVHLAGDAAELGITPLIEPGQPLTLYLPAPAGVPLTQSLAALREGKDAVFQYSAQLPNKAGMHKFEGRLQKVHPGAAEHGSLLLVITLQVQAQNLVAHADEQWVMLREALEALPFGFAVNSIKPAVEFAYANPAFAAIYGVTPEALASPDGFWEAVYENERERRLIRRRVLDDIASGDPRRMQWHDVPITRQGEEVRYVTARNLPLPGGESMLSLVFDTTCQKNEKDAASSRLNQIEYILSASIELLLEHGRVQLPGVPCHERRVAAIAETIAVIMGLKAEQVRGVRIAALLHDLGKSHVPHDLLARSSALSSDEFAMVKTHCEAGYNLLRHLQFPWPVAEVALYHHERFDGSGYPEGLRADEIPVEARIVAVADVVEAMVSARPYRSALGIAQALAELRKGRGILYDPRVVDACLAAFQNSGFRIPEV